MSIALVARVALGALFKLIAPVAIITPRMNVYTSTQIWIIETNASCNSKAFCGVPVALVASVALVTSVKLVALVAIIPAGERVHVALALIIAASAR